MNEESPKERGSAAPAVSMAACPACSGRMTARPPEVKKSLDARLARVEGQIRGLRRMIEGDAYCDDLLEQMAAVQGALSKASLLILDHHMKHCLIDRVKAGDEGVVDELLGTLGKML